MSFPTSLETWRFRCSATRTIGALIQEIETLALAQGRILHWGQSNGLMNNLDVQERFPQLAKWKAAQELFGGSTFVNLFMQRCGLV